jgi:hypothetical protein
MKPDKIPITDNARIGHELDVIAVHVHDGTLDERRLDDLARAFESRTWYLGPLDDVRIGPAQYARLKALLTDAVHARGGTHRVGGVAWRSDGTRLWAELPGGGR